MNEELPLLTRQLAEPANYLVGRGVPEGPLPGNILCFSRLRAAQLSRTLRASPPHQHHRFVLLTAIRGEGRVCLDADDWRLREGESILFFPFQFHCYANLQPARICWAFVTFEAGNAELEALRGSGPRRLGPAEELLLAELLRGWAGNAAPALLALHLGLLLARLAAQAGRKARRRGDPDERGALLARLNGYLLPRLGQPLRLKEVAGTLGLSESHLRARFRAATGTSLGRHLRDLRLRKACSLLRTTRLPVAEIAEQCGFDSLYSFSRAFKASRGIPPRSYRQEGAY